MLGEQLIDGEARKIERAIVTTLLRDDHDLDWRVSELAAELSDSAKGALDLALGRLEVADVAQRADAGVRASRATRYLDELDLIGI